MFLVLLIIYPLSDFHNSKWQTQASVCENEKKNDTIGKTMYSDVFGVADNESIVRFLEFEMACSFSVDLFVSNFWCSVFVSTFRRVDLFVSTFRRVEFFVSTFRRVEFFVSTFRRVEFLVSTFRRVRLISVQYEKLSSTI